MALIAKLTKFEGRIIWDATKPNGQPRRRLDTSRAEKAFGFRAQTNFIEGLDRTIQWYRDNFLINDASGRTRTIRESVAGMPT